jgi:hypothetical protein
LASRNRDRIEKSLIMKRNLLVLLAFSLIALPACNRDGNVNQADGVKDALDVRPNEELRDAGEAVGDAIKDAGKDLKDAVND